MSKIESFINPILQKYFPNSSFHLVKSNPPQKMGINHIIIRVPDWSFGFSYVKYEHDGQTHEIYTFPFCSVTYVSIPIEEENAT